MLVCRLNSCRSPHDGREVDQVFALQFRHEFLLGFVLRFARDRAEKTACRLFKMLTVRSGRGLPSLHQKSQPMSAGTYSASNFIASSTRRVASITSFPIPSPGIQAILYLAIGRRLYRRDSKPATPSNLQQFTTEVTEFTENGSLFGSPCSLRALW